MVPPDSVWPFSPIYLLNSSLTASSMVKIVSRCFIDTPEPDPWTGNSGKESLCLTGRNLGQDQAPLWEPFWWVKEEEKRRHKQRTCKYMCVQAVIAVFKGHQVRSQCFAGCYHFSRTTAEHSLIRFMGLIMADLIITVAVNCCAKTMTGQNKTSPMKLGFVVDSLALATHIHEVRKLEDLIKLYPVTA